MPYCSKCGASVDTGAAFCPSCGSAQTPTNVTAPPAGAAAPSPAVAQTGLSENVAGALCYLFGWVTGLIFYFVDKRPFVRFHAAQSIVTFGALHILSFILGIFFGIGLLGFGAFRVISLGWGLYSLVELAAFVLWILLMIKAFQGERFRLPVAADIAEQIFGKS
ncbi:MAG TPA: DUF4870 domain-containing protein [Candidatus Aquilonibacter sp.]|nr:DUF4870 domain-containing protein [Candidatus Aquilonibacter sp.]